MHALVPPRPQCGPSPYARLCIPRPPHTRRTPAPPSSRPPRTQLDTAGNGTGFGQWVHFFSSPWGIAFSAALRKDYWGVGGGRSLHTQDGLGPSV